MYYHVLIETNEKVKVGKSDTKNKKIFELDKTNIEEIENDILIPHFKNEKFQFNGYFLHPKEIIRIFITESEKTSKELSDIENRKLNSNSSVIILATIKPENAAFYERNSKDITKEVLKNAESKFINLNKEKPLEEKNEKKLIDKQKVFIVHGHDDTLKIETARFIERLGLEAIILHEQANGGKTIIEKIEEYTNVGFGIVLYTPCDVGGKTKDDLKNRSRQNVVFEHGYLIGKLGRKNVSSLVKDFIETPSDISGVVYTPFDPAGAWKFTLAKEMKESGYLIDMNKI